MVGLRTSVSVSVMASESVSVSVSIRMRHGEGEGGSEREGLPQVHEPLQQALLQVKTG